ncbi:MAG: DinB family protein [Terracoccus sp.]
MTDANADPTDLARAVLVDGFERIRDGVPSLLDGLGADELRWRPDEDANPIGWLVWHLSRQQDAQVADLTGSEPVWTAADWCSRFGLPYEPSAHGWGQSSQEVGAFDATDTGLLADYQGAVHNATVAALAGFSAQDYGRVIDDRWDPPVTVVARLVSVLDDAAKHLGQAEYVKGLVQRRA